MTEAKIEFDQDRANQYNLDIRQAIPGYESLHSMAHSILQTNLSKSARLLVVGSGTGMELINYCQLNPGWSLTGVDPSAEMMEVAKRELEHQSLGERVNLHPGYLDTLPQTEPRDAATLMLVMHFLPDDESKAKAEANFATSINNSIYFVSEARIIELLKAAGFAQITKFYNAFLFGGWIAKYTAS